MAGLARVDALTASRECRVLMARGRDAADVALTTTFGLSRIDEFTVRTDQISQDSRDGRSRRRSSPPDRHDLEVLGSTSVVAPAPR